MCGDMDDEPSETEKQLTARLLYHAKALLPRDGAITGQAPANLNAYLDTLFADILSRCARDIKQADPSQRYERLSMQPVVLARLAGFLAGHASLAEDPLRKVIDAMMLGYAEAEEMDRTHGTDDAYHSHGDVVSRG